MIINLSYVSKNLSLHPWVYRCLDVSGDVRPGRGWPFGDAAPWCHGVRHGEVSKSHLWSSRFVGFLSRCRLIIENQWCYDMLWYHVSIYFFENCSQHFLVVKWLRRAARQMLTYIEIRCNNLIRCKLWMYIIYCIRSITDVVDTA